MRSFRISLFAVATALAASLSLPDASHAEAWQEEVKTIASFKNAEVRRWERNPQFLYLGSEKHLADFEDVVAHLNETLGQVTDVRLVPSSFVIEDGAIDDGRLTSELRYPVNDTKEGFGITLRANQKDVLSANPDVVIAAGTALHAVTLTLDFLRKAQNARPFAKGNIPCFFRVFTDTDSIKFGVVLINTEFSSSLIKACFYEELAQMLGFPRDHVGSKIFTFDDRADVDRKENDQELIRALYSKRVSYGDPVNKLIEVMEANGFQN